MAWLLAQTIALQEFRARNQLSELDPPISVYVPTYKKLIQPRHTRKPRLVHYPLFARYLFIWIEDLAHDFARIKARTRNIWPVRIENERHVWVSNLEVEHLKQRQDHGEFDRVGPDGVIYFIVGDLVLVNKEPFIGQRGRITKAMKSHRKYKVAMSNCTLEVGVDLLERAS